MKKEVKIKSLILRNFKGIRSLNIELSDDLTDILGANGTGKTTIADAWMWLLFGKDTNGRSGFEVKTLDKNNNVIQKLEHEVKAVISVDGRDIEISRMLREKWVKNKGSLNSEFSGNTTEYFWDGVPLQQKEFLSKVSGIIEESLFKLLTNPFAFDSLKWQDKRTLLIELVGGVSDSDLAQGNTAYEELLKKLSDGKDIEQYKKQIAASIKKAKDELKLIPSRIDEVDRSKPDAINFEALENELKVEQIKLTGIDEKINDSNKAFQSELDKVRAKRVELNDLVSKVELIESDTRKESEKRCTPDTSEIDSLRSKLTDKESELKEYEDALKTLETKKEGIQSNISQIESDIVKKREEWNAENATEFKLDESDCKCPTCNRELDDIDSKKAELEASFKENKSKKLNAINSSGKQLASELQSYKEQSTKTAERIEKGSKTIESIKSTIKDLKEQIESIPASDETLDVEDVYIELLASNKDIESLKAKISNLRAELQKEPKADNEALIKERQSILDVIDGIKTKLQAKDQIKRADDRISELEKQEKELAQQIADVEKEEFVIENFIKHKIEHLEGKINAKFKMVNFKMFDVQINGGLNETCEALIDGVPFSNANTASRINAGLSIIQALSDYYGISCPVWIDNAESVTNTMLIDSQLIRLYVNDEYDKVSVLSNKPINQSA
ncbi:AAA family ATPase [Joostella sp.]|uniref:AAA family ATPase n=1 Tax=Joostella sp. TaxID=2231138 RepID=UPI003A923504